MMAPRIRSTALATGLLIVLQLGGGTPLSKSAESIGQASRRSFAPPPAPVVPRADLTWVPDRWINVPGQPGPSHVPGHWERQVNEHEFYAPPLSVCTPATGACTTEPAGVRPPVDTRPGP